MVRAILDGSKTMTRRVMNPQPQIGGMGGWYPRPESKKALHYGILDHFRRGVIRDFPKYGVAGDRLWVRETWKPTRSSVNDTTYMRYRADDSRLPVDHPLGGTQTDRWRPSIHMFRWASRIDLEITGVRVERLQDIDNSDAWREGCFALGDCDCTASRQFQILWDSINEKRGFGWDVNPWVWVISFKRV